MKLWQKQTQVLTSLGQKHDIKVNKRYDKLNLKLCPCIIECIKQPHLHY